MAELIDDVKRDLMQLWLESPALQQEADRFAARLLTKAHNDRHLKVIEFAELAASLFLCRLYLPHKYADYLAATEPTVAEAMGNGWADASPAPILRWPR